MNPKDMVRGGIYYMWFKEERDWILQFDGWDAAQHLKMLGRNLTPSERYTNNSPHWNGGEEEIRHLRPATSEEVEWLTECRKAGNFVAKPAYTPMNIIPSETVYEVY